MTQHTNAPSTGISPVRDNDSDRHKDTESVTEIEKVRYDSGLGDGPRWHSVREADPGDCRANAELLLACGLKVKLKRCGEVATASDSPQMSGSTICYGCAGSVGRNGGRSR